MAPRRTANAYCRLNVSVLVRRYTRAGSSPRGAAAQATGSDAGPSAPACSGCPTVLAASALQLCSRTPSSIGLASAGPANASVAATATTAPRAPMGRVSHTFVALRSGRARRPRVVRWAITGQDQPLGRTPCCRCLRSRGRGGGGLRPPEGRLPLLHERAHALEEVVGARKLVLDLR